LAGLVGAKVYSFWERGGGPAWQLSELTSSYRYPGGILAAVIAFILFNRRFLRGVSPGVFADAVIPATGFAMAVIRLGCFAHGCCFGRETQLPWAMAFPAHSPAWSAHVAAGRITEAAPGSLSVHPLQLYFALASLGLALVALWFDGRRNYAGQTALVFLLLDGLAKLGLETLRGEPTMHLQLAGLIAAFAAGTALIVVSMRVRQVPPRVAICDP
jgi:phosphatidylglycerol:prolipoprotein diacylglycerol transferase